ncbi:hypothetical protein [Edaphobacter albus]|uniref:hypothetical protein n=1 Tax=Edaphobacter sp. 4G125 TaxID=2763071 RepID=UPI001648A60A|nr:hypothetical protein [Edaphobacter sp. 4G125]QNI36430.1 hypothetical protein H7846_15915 [Edaphobacter sp. 4G125]
MSIFFSAFIFTISGPVFAQYVPEPIPGVQITNGSYPWAVDTYQGKQQLVPIHHTNVGVNNHKGANVAGSLAGSVFYKPKMTTEIAGAHARVALHSDRPVFYVHFFEDDDSSGSTDGIFGPWALVRARGDKDRRVLAQVNFTQLTGNAKRTDSQVDVNIEKLPEGWLKITPKAPLTPGEYALQPVPKVANTFSVVVFDFTIDPNAPNSSEAKSAP